MNILSRMEVKLTTAELELLYTNLLEEGSALTLATILEALLIVLAFESD